MRLVSVNHGGRWERAGRRCRVAMRKRATEETEKSQRGEYEVQQQVLNNGGPALHSARRQAGEYAAPIISDLPASTQQPSL